VAYVLNEMSGKIDQRNRSDWWGIGPINEGPSWLNEMIVVMWKNRSEESVRLMRDRVG